MALRAEESTIRKHLMLEDLHDRNETLYHRVLVSTHVCAYFYAYAVTCLYACMILLLLGIATRLSHPSCSRLVE